MGGRRFAIVATVLAVTTVSKTDLFG